MEKQNRRNLGADYNTAWIVGAVVLLWAVYSAMLLYWK
jgi:hypothetical protein